MPARTFTLRRKDGTSSEVAYHPLIVTAGTVTHKLALHKLTSSWAVSDPASGAALIKVTGQVVKTHQGIPVARERAPIKLARQLALADVELLIRRVGIARFNETLANPKPF